MVGAAIDPLPSQLRHDGLCARDGARALSEKIEDLFHDRGNLERDYLEFLLQKMLRLVPNMLQVDSK